MNRRSFIGTIADTLSDWWDYYPIHIVCGGVTLLFVAIVTFAVIAVNAEQTEWDKFKATHNCKVVGKQQSSTELTSDGKTVFISAKTGYKCDDGIIYWRNE